jgi:hypothetical protein
MNNEHFDGLAKRILKRRAVIGAPHAEIRKVM